LLLMNFIYMRRLLEVNLSSRQVNPHYEGFPEINLTYRKKSILGDKGLSK
jgi:hypothetical protein